MGGEEFEFGEENRCMNPESTEIFSPRVTVHRSVQSYIGAYNIHDRIGGTDRDISMMTTSYANNDWSGCVHAVCHRCMAGAPRVMHRSRGLFRARLAQHRQGNKIMGIHQRRP
jgi:hypothetical protein